VPVVRTGTEPRNWKFQVKDVLQNDRV